MILFSLIFCYIVQFITLRIVEKLYISRSNNDIYRVYSIIEITPFFFFIFSVSLYFIRKIGNVFARRKHKLVKIVKYNQLFIFGIITIASFLINFCLFISVIFHISGKIVLNYFICLIIFRQEESDFGVLFE